MSCSLGIAFDLDVKLVHKLQRQNIHFDIYLSYSLEILLCSLEISNIAFNLDFRCHASNRASFRGVFINLLCVLLSNFYLDVIRQIVLRFVMYSLLSCASCMVSTKLDMRTKTVKQNKKQRHDSNFKITFSFSYS